jgi:hypothetical protein
MKDNNIDICLYCQHKWIFFYTIHSYIKVREVETYLSEPLGLLCLATYLDKVFKDQVKVSILDLYALGATSPKPVGGGSFV